MGFFSKLFGRKGSGSPKTSGAAEDLRRYIDSNLPKSYVQSRKYALSIQDMAGGYVARITLDMLADGSDYSGFDGQDYRNIAELESNYLLTECLANPPVAACFNLEMVFGEGRILSVERWAGAKTGILTDQGQRQEIQF